MDPELRNVLAVAAVSFLTNLPLGWLRGGVRPGLKKFPKRSPEWWSALRWTMLYIHLSIPVVVITRRALGVGGLWIPVLIAVALLAQAVGERWRKRREAGEMRD